MKILAHPHGRSFLLGRWFCAAAALLATAVRGQDTAALLLPSPVHVIGRVVGEDGKPLAKVRLYHSQQSANFVTDSKGQFQFMTSAPAFVAQKPGFQSVLVHTQNPDEFQIVLHRAQHPEFPVCSKTALAGRLPGWSGVFQIARSGVVDSTREVLDVDYWSRKISVQSNPTVVFLEEGRGPMWGGGDPRNDAVWRSTQYSEVTYDLEGRLFTDARGSFPDGKCWRELGVFSESVGYSGVDCIQIKPLDDLLDRACVVSDAGSHLFP
jgi:hypothetical protein